MKKTLTLLMLVFYFLSFGQETKNERIYNFDYVLEYENATEDSLGLSKAYVFVNSKDNSYNLTFSKIRDNGYMKFIHHNIANMNSTIENDLFFKAETITLDCNYSFEPANYFKKYSFKIEKDTIIHNDTLKYYSFNRYNKKRKNKTLSHHFIIQPDTEYILPFFFITDEYEKWKSSEYLPKGIFRRIYFQDKNNKIVEMDYRLLSIYKYKKQIILPKKSCAEE